MIFTKKRDGNVWRIHANGKPTSLIIEKGLDPKFGHAQTYDVCDEADDRYLFEVKGVALAMSVLNLIGDLAAAQ